MIKKVVRLCIVLTIALSLLLVPVSAGDGYGIHNNDVVTTEEVTVHVPPNSSVAVPYGWVGSGSVIQYPVGTVASGSWVYITITSNSAGIPVIVQLYTPAGAGYGSKTLTLGTTGWKVGVTAAHYILITNDNNYGTDVSFSVSYY